MSGHGHVTPNPFGAKARCGGPALCSQCARELAVVLRPYISQIPAKLVAGGEAGLARWLATLPPMVQEGLIADVDRYRAAWAATWQRVEGRGWQDG